MYDIILYNPEFSIDEIEWFPATEYYIRALLEAYLYFKAGNKKVYYYKELDFYLAPYEPKLANEFMIIYKDFRSAYLRGYFY